MSSVTSYIKQIPLNNGFFRSVAGTSAASDASHIFTLTFATNGTFSSAALTDGAALPTGYTGLLRDMGAQYYDATNDVTYRRVQVVPNASDVEGTSAGTLDTSYGVRYIKIGRTGGAPSPFVRTG